jgi:cytochrome P450
MFLAVLGVTGTFFILLILLSKIYENRLVSRITNSETGKNLPLAQSILNIFTTFFSKSSVSIGRLTHNMHQKFGTIIGRFQFFRFQVAVATPELAKIILSDSKTFVKAEAININSIKGAQKLFNPHNVVFVNGDEWKRQRKSINPGFYDLSIYADQFLKKTQTTMDIFSKEKNVKDVHDALQKMTLFFYFLTLEMFLGQLFLIMNLIH